MTEPNVPAPDEVGQGSAPGPTQPTPGPARREVRKRQRPTKILPTDRVSFQKQKDALNAYASVYDATKSPVSNEQVGALIALNPTTAGLMNSFFVDTGFLQKVDTGFLPSDEVKAYALARQWEEEFPGHKLRPLLASTWFSQALLPHLRVAVKDEREAIAILATAANAEPAYRLNLQTLLDYLELAGLIEREGGVVRAALPSRETSPAAPEQPAPPTNTTPPSPPGTSRVVKLASGGTLTISATLDLFSLSQQDRNFVFGLIDKLEEYEASSKDGSSGARE